MGIGAKALGLGLTGLFIYPEIGKVQNAAKEGKAFKQVLGSAVNFGKWMAVPAALAMTNPVTAVGAAAVGIAGFILPNLIPDIDVAENKHQGFSMLG